MMIGVSTRVLWSVEENLALNLDFISKVADATEIWMMPPFFQSWRTSEMKGDIDRLRDVLTTYDLETTLHAPYHDMNFASLNPAIASCAVREVEKCLEVADLLGSKAVTFHPGTTRFKRDVGLKVLKGNLKRLNEKAKEHSALVCVKNMGKDDGFCISADELEDALLGLDGIHVTLDVANLFLGGGDPASFISRLGSRIRHIHISNLKGGEHVHLPLGDVQLGLMASLLALKAVGYDGMFVLEGDSKNPHNTIPEDVKELRTVLAAAGFGL